VAGSFEYGDEPSGSGAKDLVRAYFFALLNIMTEVRVKLSRYHHVNKGGRMYTSYSFLT
jgi:hypothetical protein